MAYENENQAYLMELGGFISNLQTLEYVLRVALYNSEVRKNPNIQNMKNLSDYRVGEKVPVNYLTNYDPLETLINRFNQMVGKASPDKKIDSKLAKLRDILAHGRIAFNGPSVENNTRFLIKFERPKNGQAEVSSSESLSPEWLATKRILVANAIEKVLKEIK